VIALGSYLDLKCFEKECLEMPRMSPLRNPKLYEAVLKAAMRMIRLEQPPIRILHAGSYLYRASPRHYVHVVGDYLTQSSAAEAIKVRDFDVDNNRFSGHSPLPVYSHSGTSLLSDFSNGGCYFFTNQGAGLGEMMHYAEREGFRKDSKTGRVDIINMMRYRDVFSVRVTKPLQVADISLYGPTGPHSREFLRKLGQYNFLESSRAPASVEKLFVGVKLEDEIINQHGDYSVTRALGHAFSQFPQYFAGVIAQTARETERAGESGDNVCLFGAPKSRIEGIEVVSVYRFFQNEVKEYPVHR
jgi:hypothetical protein